MQFGRFVGSLLATLTFIDLAHAVGSCGMGGPLGETLSVDHEGSLYYVTTPSSYDETLTWPLIFGLHGDEGDPADSVNWFWRDVANDSFIFVAPKAPNASGSWYEETEANSLWMDGVIERVLGEYNVDLDRVYIWGLSGGAVFSSDYALARQDVFAAVEFNMGGSARGYSPAPSEACRIPARFVVSETDFLRENALGLFDELTGAGHETVWVDANCEGHCFDEEQAGPVARDWLLGFTLCGVTPSGGCEGGAPVDTTSTASTTGGTTTGGALTGGSTTDGATSSSAASEAATGTMSTSAGVGGTGMSATGASGASGGASAANTTLGEATSAASTTGAGGMGAVSDTNTGYGNDESVGGSGCACRARGGPRPTHAGSALLLGLLFFGLRRRNRALRG